MRPTSDDAPTAPLPDLTEFFTWSAADDPHPYAPPATDLAASGTARSESVSSQTSDRGASFDPTTAITPIRRPPRMQRPLVILWSIFAVVATIAVVLWVILLWPSPEPPEATNAPTASDDTTTAAAELLRRNLPPGYRPSDCTATTEPPPAIAGVRCGPHPAIAEATTAHYTLYDATADLNAAFTDVTPSTTAQVCPGADGGYQSPGAWRRNANPEIIAGTLLCGTNQASQPMVAWTTTSTLVLATIRADTPQTPTLQQLYTWWSSHS